MHLQRCARVCARKGVGKIVMGHCRSGGGVSAASFRQGACGIGNSGSGQRCFGGSSGGKENTCHNGQGNYQLAQQEPRTMKPPAKAAAALYDGTGPGNQHLTLSTHQQGNTNVEPELGQWIIVPTYVEPEARRWIV